MPGPSSFGSNPVPGTDILDYARARIIEQAPGSIGPYLSNAQLEFRRFPSGAGLVVINSQNLTPSLLTPRRTPGEYTTDTMPTDQPRGPLATYERLLWGVMDAFGVTKTVERKMITATLLQFGAIVSIFVLGVALLGFQRFQEIFTTAEMAVFGLVFVLSVGALLNTILILQRDFVQPIKSMHQAAASIAEGELDEGVPETDQSDEIGDLVREFDRMHGNLLTVRDQADALGREEFDAAVMDESVPGSFGAALDRMEANLHERIEDLESQREAIEARNAALTQAAESYTDTIAQVADGDLTQRLDTSMDDEAMAGVARAFNRMVEEWEGMMAELITFARDVAEESQAVEANAEEVRTASEDISESVQEISAGVEQESRRLDEASDESENLSATIQEITASSDNVATLTDQTADIGETGQEAAQEAEAEMAALRERSESVTEAVGTLNETLEEIGEITDVILDIADQTNILALNAGIEAARAEAGGEGFAVVAEEVKALAQETKESAEEIEELICDVQDQSAETVAEIDEMADRVESGAETVETATGAFEEMAENVSEINTSIKEVNDATAEQAESMQDVVAMVQEIAAISDQTAAEAQTVAAAAEQQAATLNDVAANTTDLADNAEELEDSLTQFDVSRGRRDRDRGGGSAGRSRDRTADRGHDGGRNREEFGVGQEGDGAGDGPAAGNETAVDASTMEWQSLAADGGDDE